MKAQSILVALSCAWVAAACQPAVDMERAEVEVRAALDRYVECVEQEDMEGYAEIVAHDAAMMNFGAFGGPIVGWDGLREVIEGQYAALDSVQIEQSQVAVNVMPGGGDAWATSLWQFTAKAGESTLDLPVRCTWQLQKRAGGWVITHFHKSLAAG